MEEIMKKVITLLLAIIMVVSMFAACSPAEETPGGESETKAPAASGNNGGNNNNDPADPGSNDDPANPGSSETEPEEELSIYEQIGIEENLNFDNAEFTIVHWNEVRPEFYVNEEDQDGDPINDAIYKRNLYTEDLLGIDFNFIHNQYVTNTVASMNEWCDRLQNTMEDPSTPVDLFASYSRILSTATVRGLNQDIAVYDNLDLEKEWWPSAIIDELSIDGKLFIFTGEISTNVLHNMYTIFYNKTMAEAYGVGDLVQLVKDNEWTIDAMIEATSVGYQDMNADGKTPDDQFGMTLSWFGADCLVQGADFKILESSDYNETGMYVNVTEDFYSEVFDSFISKLAKWSASSYVYNETDYSGAAGNSFIEARAMFHINVVSVGFTLQETDIEYGLLPVPLRDENQTTGYRTCLGNSYTNYGMARNCKDGERAAAVIATLAYYAHELTTPAIFDVTFKGKFSKDPDMIDMFDTIRNGICFDMGLLYMRELNSINDMPTNAIATNTDWLGVKMDTFARKALNNLIKKFNGKLETIMGA